MLARLGRTLTSGARLYHSADGWQVQLQLETPAGGSPITMLAERFGSVADAQEAAEQKPGRAFRGLAGGDPKDSGVG